MSRRMELRVGAGRATHGFSSRYVLSRQTDGSLFHNDHSGSTETATYDRGKAEELTDFIKGFPNVVFEGHATDYQTARALREMVEDGLAILKVGPSLTFAARETVFMLEYMEEGLFKHNSNVTLSRFKETLDKGMVGYLSHRLARFRLDLHCETASEKLLRAHSLGQT